MERLVLSHNCDSKELLSFEFGSKKSSVSVNESFSDIFKKKVLEVEKCFGELRIFLMIWIDQKLEK